MKFYDNSRKMNISLFVIITFVLANYNPIISSGMHNDFNKDMNPKEFSASSFLSLEETNKELSEDMQYQNLFVIFVL